MKNKSDISNFMTNYECVDCGGLVKYKQKKCKYCGSELVWNDPNEEKNMIEGHKKPNAFAIGCLCIIALIVPIFIFSSLSDNKTTYTPVKSYSSLNEVYNEHRNFIRSTCKAALKIDRGIERGIEGPTYAGEYRGEFIVKGWYAGSTDNQFSCIFKKSDNQWGMDIIDVR